MTGFEYGNTRVRAMRARLLDDRDYAELLRSAGLDQLLGTLDATDWRPDVEVAISTARGTRRLDVAVRTHLSRLLRRVLSFYEGAIRRRLEVVTRRWDLHNLVTLIRAKASSVPSGDVGDLLIPAGRLSATDLRALQETGSLRALVDTMVVWDVPGPETARAVLRAWPRYETSGDVTVLEQALHVAFAEQNAVDLGNRQDAAWELTSRETDIRNLETALRLRRAEAEGEWVPDEEPPALPGGRVAERRVTAVRRAPTVESAAELLADAALPLAWRPAVQAWEGHGDDARLIRDLEAATLEASMRELLRSDPLDIAVPVGFMAAAEAEAINVRLIGLGTLHNLPRGEIEDRLILA